eukprot:scaffold166373_cov27-Prasinocladus_malaysianus.AAC.2
MDACDLRQRMRVKVQALDILANGELQCLRTANDGNRCRQSNAGSIKIHSSKRKSVYVNVVLRAKTDRTSEAPFCSVMPYQIFSLLKVSHCTISVCDEVLSGLVRSLFLPTRLTRRFLAYVCKLLRLKPNRSALIPAVRVNGSWGVIHYYRPPARLSPATA